MTTSKSEIDAHDHADPAHTDRPRRRWLRMVLVSATLVVTVLVLAAIGAAVMAVRSPFPVHDGELVAPSLDAPVEIVRDTFGVPTVIAESSADLYRAQGFTHAQDRFWQMDTWRHITAGRTAEMFGPSQLPTDRFLRTLGWHRIAEEELALLDPETIAMLEAYAEGVNDYLAQTSQRGLGVGYSVLGLTGAGYEVDPWEPVDSVAFLKLMAWDLRNNFEDELTRAILARTLSAEQLDELYPPYDDDVPVIVEGTGTPAPPAPLDLEAASIAGALDQVADRLAAVEATTGSYVDGVGSNSWVIGGDATASGLPILADDPHLGIGAPSIWYEIGLRCATTTADCVENVAGFSFAGVPGVVIGRNDRIAWGFTNLGADVTDLVVERVRDDAYERDGVWQPLETRTETLRASDGSSEELEVRLTGNGPIISDAFRPVDDIDLGALGFDPDGAYAIALRWTALEPTHTADAILGFARAQDFADFREAAADFAVPSQNLVYADTDGTIGYQAPGRIPIRHAGDGRLPVPGWDSAYEWQGYIDADELPWIEATEGVIVTANNPVVGDDYPYLLTADWNHGMRAARIGDLIAEAGTDLTPADVVAMQMDTYDPIAERIVPALLAVSADGDDQVAAMQDVLDGWDLHADADSAGAAAFAASWSHLLARTFGPHLPDNRQPAGYGRWAVVTERLLDEPDDDWWDDPDTAQREDRDMMLRAALADAHAELTNQLGDDPARWQWGDLHTATFREGTLGASGIGPIERIFNRGPYPTGGGADIVQATGWVASNGYEVVAVPSMRMVVDMGDPDGFLTIHSTGQSGHPFHRNYTDMIELWRTGDMRSAPWSLDATDAASSSRLMLSPGNG